MELLRPDSQQAQAQRYDWQRRGILARVTKHYNLVPANGR